MAKFNPFNSNSVVTPSLFAGRYKQVDDICKKLAQLKHGMAASFFVYGERGIGKTALAKLINHIASSKDKKLHNLDLLTSYYAVEKGQNISGVLQESVNKLTDKMDETLVNAIGKKVGKLFSNGKFEIGAFGASVTVDTKEEQHRKDITIKDQTLSILSNIVKTLNENGGKEQDGILIIIDEIHNLKELSGAASIFRNVATSLDFESLGKVSFLLIGYKEDIDQFFTVDISSRRIFDLKDLGVMPDTEAIEILKKGFGAANVRWDDAVLSGNIEIAGGYPHSIQILGHNLIEKDTDSHINGDDWNDVIIETAIELQEKEFSTMYTFNKKQTIKDQLLIILAQENKPMTRQEIIKKGLNKTLSREILELKKRGAIKENDESKLYLQSQLFRVAILFDIAKRKLTNLD